MRIEEAFPANLRRIMDKKGMTPKELYERTGVPRNSIYRYGQGRGLPTLYNAVLIAGGLGCSLDDLVEGADK